MARFPPTKKVDVEGPLNVNGALYYFRRIYNPDGLQVWTYDGIQLGTCLGTVANASDAMRLLQVVNGAAITWELYDLKGIDYPEYPEDYA